MAGDFNQFYEFCASLAPNFPQSPTQANLIYIKMLRAYSGFKSISLESDGGKFSIRGRSIERAED
jgi:hypothetical protein